MTRLPLRVRLALAFALAMAVVFAAVAGFLYARLGASLEEQLDDGLRTRAETLAALVRESSGAVDDQALASADDEGFAQVVGADGRLVASSPSLPKSRLIASAQVRRASSESFFVNRDDVAGFDGEPLRLLVSAVDVGDRQLVLLTGASLEDVEDARSELLAQLVVIVPIALFLATVGGYLLAAAALRPVERMRGRAAAISAAAPGARLPLPPARDEIRRLGETLNAMLGRLEAGLERERRFVADASHELRTPLSLLKAELELASRPGRTPDELQRAIRSAADEVDRLIRLAEDLLVLARSDEDGLPLRTTRLDASELMERVAERFAEQAAERGRQVAVAAAPELAVEGDPLRLEQALANLVDNALRHGGGDVHLSAERSNHHVELRVTDEGTGFAAGFLPRAFERLAQGDEARGKGAGLGLAIVDTIARAHGGEARAANRDGGGATVCLSLPTPSD